MAKNLISVIIAGSKVVGRAFAKAFQQELEMSKQAAARHGGGRQGEKKAAADLSMNMSLQEAREILNIEDIANKESVEKSYKHLFDVNDKSKGGSFYLQSKVVRAKERIEVELKAEDQETLKTDTDSENRTEKT
ncbi:mitochondrial import inner membrane translocase subunit Tim16-like [Mya arenaria]|uniref:mitochondrial import inner membrane translocase subunit Tim16-like n=1 Tax=Mya arenaria TaxID=6604 RepID=UPI0022E05E5F|nr:mitochondrial import inner membrane translocase subunit Tim16-like [Mya arenaria]